MFFRLTKLARPRQNPKNPLGRPLFWPKCKFGEKKRLNLKIMVVTRIWSKKIDKNQKVKRAKKLWAAKSSHNLLTKNLPRLINFSYS
jgi:hypothetical protein